MQTIVNNLKINAPSQYINYNHHAFCVFNGATIGAGPGGILKLCCGDTDNGTQIDAYFIPATSDFGLRLKRLRYVYFSYECSGSMSISFTGNGSINVGSYNVSTVAGESAQRRRVNFGRGPKWQYGEAKIENVAGASFQIDEVSLLLQEVSGGK